MVERECVNGFWTEWDECPVEEPPQCRVGEFCCEPMIGGGCLFCAGNGTHCPLQVTR